MDGRRRCRTLQQPDFPCDVCLAKAGQSLDPLPEIRN